MKLKVPSAANKKQTLSKVGAALYVITREDIASSGANNIPDLSRLVPGVDVAGTNSSQWAISIRDFNSLFLNKVLALIDRRALYQPSFSTVLWGQQGVPLEDTELDALSVQGTWRHTLAGGSETTLRVYFDHMRRDGEAGADISNDTVDADLEHRVSLGPQNDVVWGLNLRVHTDDIRARGSHSLQVIPEHSTIPFLSGFFHDEIRVSKSLFLTVGSNLEHNDYTGLEYEPGAHLVWSPSDRLTLWTSVARTIRQPNRLDFGFSFNLGITAINGIPALLKLFGNHNVEAKELRNYEAGYRSQLHPGLSLDFAGFLSYYRHLETSEPETPQLSMTLRLERRTS